MTVVVTYTESAPGSVSYNSTESGQPTSSWSGVYTTKTISKTRTTTATRSRTRSSTRTRTIKTSDSTYVESSTDDSTSDLQTLPQSTSATETTSTDLEPTESSASNSTIAFSNCPVEGAPCIESTQGCNSLGYALCINSKWAIYPCSVGTTCYLLGTVAACDWEGVHAVDSCMSQPIVRKSLELAKESQEQITNNNNDVFHPTSIYTSHGIASRVEYVPISTAQNKFTGLLKIQSLLHPIPSRWKIKFQIPDSQTIEYADSGTVTLNKTSVTISSNQTASSHKSMALSIELRGTYEGTYHVPNFSTLILSSL
ncbi:hypothetical protein GGI05_005527 [Coemansia sp. RSA 2603]|nr:hypothetical protein GGI05_005527 [Coemansia sp. RSA 2603]